MFSIALLLPAAAKAVKADFLFLAKDTRVVSARWIEENIPVATKIAVDHTSFRPQIAQTKEQISDKYKIAGAQGGLEGAKRKKIDLLLKSIGDKLTYEVYFLTYKKDLKVQFLSAVPSLPYDLDNLINSGIYYVVVNYNAYSRQKSDFIGELKKRADVVAEFSPYYSSEIRLPFDRIDHTFMPVNSEEVFSRYMTGPTLVIYKIKAGQ